MLLAEDLLLLLYDDESGKPISGSPQTDYALAGAVLLELTMLGKIDVAGQNEDVKKDRLVVRDPAPTGDPVLDERLALIGGKEGSKPQNLIGKLSKNLREALLERLAGQGIVKAEKGKVLGLFPITRWPAQDARHENDVRAALDAALRIGTQPDQRTAALVALLHSVDVVPKIIIDHPDKKALKRRAKEISESAWAADAVRKAVQAVQASMTAVIVASASAGAAGSS
jgi:Golgi phosphoprotein 3 (GPP34)